jgi:hypothetical protein
MHAEHADGSVRLTDRGPRAPRQIIQLVTIRVFRVHLLGICASNLPLRRCRRMITEVLTDTAAAH